MVDLIPFAEIINDVAWFVFGGLAVWLFPQGDE